jgi:RimJ/RimL family protein N-acetyltransferase
VRGSALTLVALTAESIRALAAEPAAPLSQQGLPGLAWPEDDRRVLRYRAEALAADPDAWPWLLHVALDEHGALAGRIGCHARPVGGRVEIGYHVRPEARGHGVATRMLASFSAWLREQGVDTLVLTIGPDNAASIAIARRAGFVQVGQEEDDEDGLQLVLERRRGTGPPVLPRDTGRPPYARG